MKRTTLQLTVVAALLVAAAPADALYLATPLLLSSSTAQAEVGDHVDFSIEPMDDNSTSTWAGRTVRVFLSYDTTPAGAEPAEDGSDWVRVPLGEPLVLDDGARGSFSWTVPAELDDKNVGFLVEAGEDELIAHRDIAIGDAEPMMRIAMGTEGGGPVLEDAPAPETDDGTETAPKSDGDATTRDTPVGPLVGLAALGVAAFALRRRS